VYRDEGLPDQGQRGGVGALGGAGVLLAQRHRTEQGTTPTSMVAASTATTTRRSSSSASTSSSTAFSDSADGHGVQIPRMPQIRRHPEAVGPRYSSGVR
jgi:hypothetical protein